MMGTVVSPLRDAAKRIASGFDAAEILLGDDREITIAVVHDGDSKPGDADCYSAEDIARWKRDEWVFCGLIVVLKDVRSDTASEASLFGVERRFKDDETDWFEGHLRDMIGELASEQRLILRRIDRTVTLLNGLLAASGEGEGI